MMPDFVVIAGSICFDRAEQLEGALVARLGADVTVEARDGLDVVVVDDRLRLDDGAQGVPVALEVGCQDLDLALRAAVADGADAGGPDARRRRPGGRRG